jgi:hypothetical protein
VDLQTQLFANMIMQLAGMTMICLGVTPHPETGKTMYDLEAAKHFISQLEMLEARTKGNLSPEESALLKQSLTSVRMAFVTAVEKGAPASVAPTVPAPAPSTTAAEPAPAPERMDPTPSAEEPNPSPDEERRKFVKKY